MKIAIALAAGLALAAPAGAEISKNNRIDAADAQKITDACNALAAKNGWKMHVAVLNEYGDLARFTEMDGATRTSATFAQLKARTVFRTGRSTREAGKMEAWWQGAFDAVPIPGGLPVMVNGHLVGVVGASGAQPDQDEACAQAGIDAAM